MGKNRRKIIFVIPRNDKKKHNIDLLFKIIDFEK